MTRRQDQIEELERKLDKPGLSFMERRLAIRAVLSHVEMEARQEGYGEGSHDVWDEQRHAELTDDLARTAGARASIAAGEPLIPWEQVKAEAGLSQPADGDDDIVQVWCEHDGCYTAQGRHELTAWCEPPRNTAIRIARALYEVRQRQWPPDARVDWDSALTAAQRADEANAVQDLLGRRVIRPGN